MNCESLAIHIDDYIDGTLAAPLASAFDAHARQCAACAAKVAAARRLRSALAAYPIAPPAPGFEERVLARAAERGRRQRSPRLIAGVFVAAFAASVLTVIFTGLLVEAPRTELAAGLPSVEMVVAVSRDVNLVFASSAAVEDVTLLVSLPAGIELVGHEGQRQVRWRTRLVPGNNILPLTLVAAEPAAGQLVARLRHGEKEKIFRVHVSASPG